MLTSPAELPRVAPKPGSVRVHCKVSELKMSHYASRLLISLARVATLQTNGTKALPGSVRVHKQSLGALQNATLC